MLEEARPYNLAAGDGQVSHNGVELAVSLAQEFEGRWPQHVE